MTVIFLPSLERPPPPTQLQFSHSAQTKFVICDCTIEHSFGRLKGKPLSLTPMYLQDDDRATGLVRLLTIGLRVLTLFEFGVRRGLSQAQEKLSGLYAGNPKRATARPSAETLLAAFKEITLTVVTLGQQVHRHLPPLSALQHRILTLLGFSGDIYTILTGNFSLPP